MLLFIAIQPIHTYRILLYFNTSHVTVYLIELFGICFCHNDFNTSHVTVYHSYIVNCLLCSIFQYISCYRLSEKKPSEIIQEFLFQYISCYCLSVDISQDGYLYVEFQYISCYCLSPHSLQCIHSFLISIHLMLLFI